MEQCSIFEFDNSRPFCPVDRVLLRHLWQAPCYIFLILNMGWWWWFIRSWAPDKRHASEEITEVWDF